MYKRVCDGLPLEHQSATALGLSSQVQISVLILLNAVTLDISLSLCDPAASIPMERVPYVILVPPQTRRTNLPSEFGA